jgi:hypothetical protein
MELDARGITSTVVLFGGARIPRPDAAEQAKTARLAGMARY